MKNIVHVIFHDKFTAGYINYMKTVFGEYEHMFLVSKKSFFDGISIDGKLIDEVNVIRYDGDNELAHGPLVRSILEGADRIVITGFFSFERAVSRWPRRLLNKTYIQYWGGDFRGMENRPSLMKVKELYPWLLKKYIMKRCGAIFLLEEEIEAYRQVMGYVPSGVFVAHMPNDPTNPIPFEELRTRKPEWEDSVLRIVIGNNATPSNHHFEAFAALEHLKEDDIEIWCPLSYANEEYREQVIIEGNRIFGAKFHALTDWMDIIEYHEWLSRMDVGVFCNDRQQAMGNIVALLKMVRRVFLRPGTGMFQAYVNDGWPVRSTDELSELTYEDLKNYPNREEQIRHADEVMAAIEEKRIHQWKAVFDTNYR